MSIKVLVADDSITIQKVISIIFGGDEYSLTVVDNGKAAVEKARDINPDILLIDALMPGMTGYEVVEMVRSTPLLANKPILILTGSFEPFDEEKAKNCGADDFISKPFESQQIITKVKELLKLGSSRVKSAQALPPQSILESLREQAPEVSAPIFDISAPIIDQRPEIPQPTALADIWGAFTPEVEQRGEAVAAPGVVVPSEATVELDTFSIVTEESDAQLVQTAVPAYSQTQNTGSQWIPVEENTFEFEEEAIAKPPVLAETHAFESISVSEMAIPAVTPLPVNLTEEQLKAAITAASKEVIERIVWEVVPDLAEAMIREAVRKIKEGV